MSSRIHTPPASPSPATTPPSPHPHEYNAIIHSIQRRSRDRASTSSSSEDAPSSPSWRGAPPSPDSAALLANLESDLRLSAQVGVALLEEKGQLEKRLATVEGANQKLLERLTNSVKESSQLQRRLEEAVGNLEQAESNNRSLLVALEEDRKKISRLAADGARASTAASQLKTLLRSHEDIKQELSSERRRAQGAEARVRKQGERVVEMEERLRRAIADLEEMRQDKVLRSRKSNDALARVRARFAESVQEGVVAGSESGENAELLKLVESLVSENDALRSESVELHELLDVSRDEQSGLRSTLANREAFVEEDEDLLLQADAAPTAPPESLLSPSNSTSLSDFERPNSPTSTNPTSFARSSWAPSSNLSSSRAHGLARTNSSRSTSPSATEEPSRHAHFHYLPDANKRRAVSGAVALGRSTGPGKVPFGRGHGRRAMSMDVTSYNHRASGDYSSVADSAPPSPKDYHNSPPLRAESVVSTDDESSIRLRRHHRPLSLSLGPSLFPLVPEDAAPVFSRQHRQRPSVVSISVSNPGGDPSYPQSALSLSSPERKRRWLDDEPPPSASAQKRILVTVDSGTQTSPTQRPSSPSFSSTSLHNRSTSPLGFDTPPPSASGLSASTSDGERHSSSGDFSHHHHPPSHHTSEGRTASLGALIEHASKLLGRIQSADIATLEKRLKKQNLPGDVRHLAQANLKDLVTDIEGLRTHFRRIVEQERATSGGLAPSSSAEPNSSESLVLRRDFVSLVKLFRDLLFETSRLRALVNRVQLDPALASSLRELDTLNAQDTVKAAPNATSSLLAPFSRLFATALSPAAAEAPPSSPSPDPTSSSSFRPIPRPSPRPIAKLSGSSAITSATVNVEFGGGAARRAVAHGPHDDAPSTGPNSPDVKSSPRQGSQGSLGRKKSETQVKRDLSSIFAGGLPPVPRSPSAEPWTLLPSSSKPRGMPSNPFGRLLAAYRPSVSTMSTTANAVLDSFAHAPQAPAPYEPTLLERQLRPRGLSDSSIRSTFIAHANPHHRLISPATLALSAEVTLESGPQAIPIVLSRSSDGEADGTLKAVLSTSMLRKPSMNRLRAASPAPSGSSSSSDQPPPLPISISISPSTHHSTLSTPVSRLSDATSPPALSGSLFNNLSHWASKAAGMSTISLGPELEEDRGRPARAEEWTDEINGAAGGGPRGESWARRSGGRE